MQTQQETIDGAGDVDRAGDIVDRAGDIDRADEGRPSRGQTGQMRGSPGR